MLTPHLYTSSAIKQLDMRRDVEVKDEILQREEKKAGPLKFIQIYLKWIRHSPFRFALGEKMCHGDCY